MDKFMIKICLSGKAGSGKNFFLDIVRRDFPKYTFMEKKFASHIYEAAEAAQYVLGISLEKDGKLLQLIGALYRERDPDFWVNKFFADKEGFDRNHIITDCRFANELLACKMKHYITVRIERQEELRLAGLGNRDPKHESEVALDGVNTKSYDFVINNHGTVESFEAAVHEVMKYAIRLDKSGIIT